ncbi:MAG: PAS domain S-box protein [Archaeoglobus sp.]|uniref:PAS domain S-box protein n=1 Tax=Archaeoglobus sp. TaxID=1872626 RepID=UPI001DFA1D94|nr:PAS domain S-box protein [Archaeoglobus sp.]MBO8180103.1 PAS domain S-box protein [Archaeoglobus sp.]
MQINFEEVAGKSLSGIYIHDENFRIVYVNDMVVRATKYSKDELIGMNVLDLAHPDDVQISFDAAKKALLGEEIFYEVRYCRKDGGVRWVWGFARPLHVNGERYVLGNWIDITRVKELEQKLKESEGFYRSLIEDSLTPVYIIQDGKMVYVNRAFEEYTGYSKEEVLGGDPFFIIHSEDREEVYTKYIERETGRRDVDTYSWRITTKNGELRWLTARPSRITYKGRPAVAATVVDTTSIHTLNDKLRIREDYLRLLNKVLRHDIANALVLVRAVLEEREGELSKKALSRVDHITRLIREIANLESALEEIKPVRMDRIVEEVAESLGTSCDCEEVEVMANESIRTIAFNLIHNSLKHSGGDVFVEVKKDKGWGVLRVADNGKGIPEHVKERIFDEGFTTGGSGLGLFIVRKLTDILGGVISVYDNKPTGTVFEVRFRAV